MKNALYLLFAAVALCACAGKDPDISDYTPPSIKEVHAVAGADYSRVSIVCQVSSADGIKDYGILFGEDDMRRIPASNLRDNVFSVEVDGLEYSKKYSYQAYIDGGQGAVYSKTQFWATIDETPPVPSIIKATRAYGAGAGKATLDCNIPDLAKTVGKDILQCGVCYSPSGTLPTVSDAHKDAEGFSEEGAFSVEVSGLVTSATYTFRPYTIIREQISYGEPLSLHIPSSADVVVTQGYSDLTHYSVTLEGSLSEEVDSGERITCAFEINGTAILSSIPDETRHFFLSLETLMPDTDYEFRAVAQVGDNTFYGETLSFRTPSVSGLEYEYVDLGLSVLWATCNLGASDPSEPGDPYAWGETEPKTDTEAWWSNYKWCLGSETSIFKYTVNSEQADGKTVLDREDDAAAVKLGGKWRMPTADECRELIENTLIRRTDEGDVRKFLVTSKIPGYTDKGIYFYDTLYWTSSLCQLYPSCAQSMRGNYGDNHTLEVWDIESTVEFYLDFYAVYLYRASRHSIRPVRER